MNPGTSNTAGAPARREGLRKSRSASRRANSRPYRSSPRSGEPGVWPARVTTTSAQAYCAAPTGPSRLLRCGFGPLVGDHAQDGLRHVVQQLVADLVVGELGLARRLVDAKRVGRKLDALDLLVVVTTDLELGVNVVDAHVCHGHSLGGDSQPTRPHARAREGV